MNRKSNIKTKLRQSSWLLMACFCVVFSSAIKKVIQLHADQKMSMIVHTENDGSRLSSQSIKDGHREKHEIQAITFSDNKQSPAPGFHHSLHLSALQVAPSFASVYAWVSSRVSYTSRQAIVTGSIPGYILFRKIIV